MANKLQQIKDLSFETSKEITSTPEKWLEFLDTASNNYKYSFQEQVLIYAQRPDATACADINTWNTRLHRWIQKGAKGIVLITNDGTSNSLRHVFDISDTYDKFGRNVFIWKNNHKLDNEIIEDLENKFGTLEIKDDLAQAIFSTASNLVEDNIQDYLKEIQDIKYDNFLEDLTDSDIQVSFKNLITNSVTYMMLKRCDIDPSKYYDRNNFSDISNFNSIETISRIGAATSEIAEVGLREIESTIINLQISAKNKIYTFDKNKNQNYNKDNIKENIEKNNKEVIENGDNLSQRGRLYDSGSNNREGAKSDFDQVWQRQIEVYQGEQERSLHRTNDETNPITTLEGDTRNSSEESFTDSQGTSREEQSKRGIESQKPNSLGTGNEQLQESSRGDSLQRDNIQLNQQINLFDNNKTEDEQKEVIDYLETIKPIQDEELNNVEEPEATTTIAEVENTPAIFNANNQLSISQEEIDNIVREGGNIEESKFRIYEHLTNPFNGEKGSEYLKREYGIGGYTNGDRWVNFDSRGIEIRENDNSILLNWNKVASMVNQMIKNDTYFTPEEAKEYIKHEDRMKQDFAENYYDFCVDNNIYDWGEEREVQFISDDEPSISKSKEERINDILNEIKDKDSILAEIKYLQSVKESENNNEKLGHSIDVFIEFFNRYYKEVTNDVKMPQIENTIESDTNEVKKSVEEKPQEKIDFQITDDNLGVGTPRERFRNNINAIKTLKTIESENRLATKDEQIILSKYVGWGGLAAAFDENKWPDEYKELKAILTDEEYKKARESTLTSFYTPPIVIKSIYQALQNMGLDKANVLEPSCGIGNFFGLKPTELNNLKFYGVELDDVSGRIAKELYQNANIKINGFEKTNLPDSFYDVAIGNVPFGTFKVNDPRYDKNNFLIHDYFFAKTLDKVRPGGVIAFITSKGTLDKENPEVRKYIAQRADLLGAIRLPDNTFKDAAGTKVTSDIIFLQKRDSIRDIMPDWVYLDTDENNISMNKYFIDNPEMVLGKMQMVSTQYGYDSTCVADENTTLEEQLKYAITNIHGEITENQIENEESLDDIKTIPADPNIRNFSYTVVDGDIYYRENSIMTLQDVPLTNKNRIIGMIKIRDKLRELIDFQLEEHSDEEIRQKQLELSNLYDNFSANYGIINSRANATAFQDDSSYFLLCSLEKIDSEGKFLGKADIFTKRTIKPNKVIERVDTSNEALIVSLQEKAKVDLDYMSKLVEKPKEEIIEDLRGVIFNVPSYSNSNEWVTADEYLSGNVREKLKIAEEFAKENDNFNINVEYLKQVVPKDLSASEIGVKLGSTWIPPEIIKQFIFETLDTPGYNRWNIKVNYSDITSEWYISNKNCDSANVKANSTYGTRRINAYNIIERTLNLKDVKIYDNQIDENGNKIRVLNKKETAIANAKQEIIKQAFQDWIWKDPERREKLTRLYNDKFNSIVPRTYDGSHLNFVGMNPEIKLREHQLNAVAHILYGNNVLLAHEVGAGKTFEMVAAAMESKRLGLCNKPLIAVPNHIVEQFASEFLQLYPSANILVTTKKDFETKNRKKFCSRIATGDFDAIIIGHSQFEKIPMSIERQRELLERQIDDIVQGIKVEKENRNSGNYTVKQMEKTKKSLENRLEKLNKQDRKDDVVTFEQLGVDKLFVDEAHNYKNLFLYTKMQNVGGIAQTEAQKSSDLFMKCQYLDEITHGKGVVFATGTPVSNSMVELYTMQRYLQYHNLQKENLEHFDNWASTFGETVTAVELAPEGTTYRAKTRFAKFHNLPELMSLFKEVADIQTQDTLQLPRPESENHNVVVKPSEMQKEMVSALGDRAEAIRNGAVDPKKDNMLKITNEGRKLALDQRLINPLLSDDENSKVNTCANNIYQIWNDNKEQKSTQLVFCDLSTPKEILNKEQLLSDEYQFKDVYNDLKRKLIMKGIPENEIKFIHEADTEVKKKELFAKVRKGDVRVLIGSTSKMGAGTNVQDKIIALHHLDTPWRPSDLTQREGRMIRQGNENKLVHVYTYVTEGTFDSYLYQLVEQKQKFISQIMTSKTPMRSMEDIDERALSYGEIKALATGNPKILEKTNLDVEVNKLKLIKQNFMSQKYDLQDKIIKFFPEEISRQNEKISAMEEDSIKLQNSTKVSSNDEKVFSPMIINGVEYTDKEKAAKELLTECQNIRDMESKYIGEYRGFKMELSYDSFVKSMRITLRNKYTYRTELGTDAFGNITRINNLLDNIEKQIPLERDKLDNLNKQFETAKVEVTKEFPQEQELKEKQDRLNQVNAELNIKDDENEIIGDDEESKDSKEIKQKGDETRS